MIFKFVEVFAEFYFYFEAAVFCHYQKSFQLS